MTKGMCCASVTSMALDTAMGVMRQWVHDHVVASVCRKPVHLHLDVHEHMLHGDRQRLTCLACLAESPWVTVRPKCRCLELN